MLSESSNTPDRPTDRPDSRWNPSTLAVHETQDAPFVDKTTAREVTTGKEVPGHIWGLYMKDKKKRGVEKKILLMELRSVDTRILSDKSSHVPLLGTGTI